MKYIIIPFIALGLSLSMLFGVEYTCEGPEMFPEYYGSPFIYMQENLGSSMEYFYSITGLLLNTLVWSIPLFLIHYGVTKWVGSTSHGRFSTILYKVAVGILMVFAVFNIMLSVGLMGNGFKQGQNYWYWNMDEEAKIWGMACEGEWRFGNFY